MIFPKLLFSTAMLLTVSQAFGQYDYEAVFPNQSGQVLYENVAASYKPSATIPYATARDTLFLKIDAVNNNLSCIYTGLTINIPEGTDPTQAVFMNGANDGINTEHSYPLGKGAEGLYSKSDMHILFPSRVKTNADRADLPYGECNDSQTTLWYLNTTESTNKPTSNIDAYSEIIGGSHFEPREAVKGDLARAIFYFYTMYRDQALAQDVNFFDGQKSTLCAWHDADPVDKKEWDRSQKIAFYQENKANPFVLDCTLASRMYCSSATPACLALNINGVHDASHIFVSPTVSFANAQTVHLNVIDGNSAYYQVAVYNIWGGQVLSQKIDASAASSFNLPDDQKGIFIVKVENDTHQQVITKYIIQ